MRREFDLPEEDVAFLDSEGFQWETVIDGGNHWVIILDFPVPTGYNTNSVSCAIQIMSGYPASALDMAYFHPWLKRLDGVHIGQADQPMQINSLSYQRWSRHYPWRADFHNLGTHITSIKSWLEREFIIKPMQGVPNL
jgi:hypothetical protein